MKYLPRLSRRWWIATASVVGLALLVIVGLTVIYPRVGAKLIREKVSAKVGGKLGRDVRMGKIEVSLGHAVIHDIEIHGPHDGMTPLVHVQRVEIAFATLPSLIGRIELGPATIDGVLVTLRRGADGRDNVSDIITRLRDERGKPSKTGRGGSRSLPSSIELTRGKLLADDGVTGTTAIVGDGTATWRPGELVAQVRDVTATTISAPRASAATIDIKKIAGAPPTVAVAGGELSIFPKLALSGITGTVIASPDRPDHFVIDFVGGYGGVPGNLWTAKGGLDTRALTATLDLEAAKFQLDRLAPILEQSPVVDYAGTAVDTKLHLEVDRDGGTFAGNLHLTGLNVGHPMIAEKEVHDLDLTANVEGTFSRSLRRLHLTRGDLVTRGIPFSITGTVGRPLALMNQVLAAFGYYNGNAFEQKRNPETGELIARDGPAGIQYLKLRFVMPAIDCQRVLDAIPEEMAPYMTGYRLRGVFSADVNLDIDWADLDDTVLGGYVGIKRCKVISEPKDSPKRLEEEFEHYVEVEKDQWVSFVVGPTNEDFVPIADISPYLIKSIMTTEDAGFYHHKGFITSEFRTALIKNLQAGRFRFGASSITMQFVKNVLLYREKTLARKLQELFLTWHVENTLEKDRILEIYFNVIEYGPNLYGIGPAARHFFGKPPKDLNPVEAAFFSSILPAPKERYKQYCANTLTKWTDAKIKRILLLMLKRERITQAEYDLASATPLLFVKDGSETEDECMKRTKKAIKNARSTNPLKR